MREVTALVRLTRCFTRMYAPLRPYFKPLWRVVRSHRPRIQLARMQGTNNFDNRYSGFRLFVSSQSDESPGDVS